MDNPSSLRWYYSHYSLNVMPVVEKPCVEGEGLNATVISDQWKRCINRKFDSHETTPLYRIV